MASRILIPFTALLPVFFLSFFFAFSQPPDVILRGGWLIDGVSDSAVRNTGIRIRSGKFMEVGADLKGRDLSGATVIRLDDDEFILPGIFDLHAHYNLNLFGRRRKDEYTVNPVIFLANGVTSTFPAGEFDPQGMMQARIRIDRGEQIGARIFNSGPYFGAARPGWDPKMSIAKLNREVDYWAEHGVGGFKAKRIDPEHLRALIVRAHMHGLTVTGHLGSGYKNSVNPRDAILMGIDRIEHFLGGDAFPADRPAYDSLVHFKPGTPEFRRIVSLFLKYHVVFDATLTAYGYFGERHQVYDHWEDERGFLTPFVQNYLREHPHREIIKQFEKIYWVKQKTIKAFYDAGGTITLGTDHPGSGDYLSGFGAHREMEALVLSGIPAAAVLKIATINGARALGVCDKLGSIEVGKLADLFVVRGNPLQRIRNTRNVQLVIKGGVIFRPGPLLDSVKGKMGPADAEAAKIW